MADLFITPETLVPRLGLPDSPAVVDMRTPEDARTGPTRLPAARLVSLAEIEVGWDGPPDVVVYCQKGGKISQLGAATLRGRGLRARALVGGHLAWHGAGLPVQSLDAIPSGARWVMPLDPDWAALGALWLLLRWVDPTACLRAVARDQVEAAAAISGARALPANAKLLAQEAGLTGAMLPPEAPWAEVLLRGRLSRCPDPVAALDLVDDLAAGQRVVA